MTSPETSVAEEERGSDSRFVGVALGLLYVAVALSRWLLRARAADGPDSLGFIAGMAGQFDMELLQPHFPGYPVYVALGKALCRLGLSGLTAATAVSSLAAGVSAWGLAVCAERLAGPRARVPVVLLYLVAWLPWLLGSAALSDSLGSALAIDALAQIARAPPRHAASGFLAGILLGARASYWPIVLSLLVLSWSMSSGFRQRARVFIGLAVGILLWAVPFLGTVGLGKFIALGRIHLRGHFGWWGGSLATQSNLPLRLWTFIRDTLFDGLAPSLWALVAIALILVATALWARSHPKPPGMPFVFVPLVAVLVPYGVWAFAAQNIVEQPRHVLPLVEGGIVLMAAFLAPHRWALTAVLLLVGMVTVPLIWQRAHLPPAAAQAAAWVAEHEVPESTAIMADRSWRFFSELPGDFTVRKHAWLSEVIGDLSRFHRFPSAIWLTSEIDLYSGEGRKSGCRGTGRSGRVLDFAATRASIARSHAWGWGS